MASLFHVRKLSTAYANRAVVNHSVAVRTVKDVLSLRVCIDFGVNGKLERRADIEQRHRKPIEVLADLKRYEESIYEVINILEDAIVWIGKTRANGDEVKIFNRVICQEHPLMFHIVKRERHTTFSIFGEGLFDFSIKMDLRPSSGYPNLIRKIADMLDTFRDHLTSIEKLSLVDSVGQAKTQEEGDKA